MKKNVLSVLLFTLIAFNCFSQNENMITVTGESKIISKITRVVIYFKISVEGPTIKEVQNKLYDIIENVIDELERNYKLDEKDMVQLVCSIEKKYETINKKRQFKGFIAKSKYSLTHKLIEKQKYILNCLVDNGITEIIQVKHESDIEPREIEEAYIRAFNNAKLKANALLKQSGSKLGSVIKINEISSSYSFIPEGPPGIEDNIPPAYRDLNIYHGMMYNDKIIIVVTFEIIR